MSKVHITFFRDKFAKSCTSKELTLEQLRKLIEQTDAKEKEKLPWLKLAAFGGQKTKKGSLRNDGNVISISGIEGDYDDKAIPFDKAVEIAKAAKLNAVLYTSPSHCKAEPKWRVLLPTPSDQPPERRSGLMQRAKNVFGDIFSGESDTLSQSYYYGSVNDNPDHRVVLVNGGAYIDQRSDLDAVVAPPLQPTTEPSRKQRAENLLAYGNQDRVDWSNAVENILGGNELHVNLRGLAASMVTSHVSPEAAKGMLKALMYNSSTPHDGRWQARFNDIDRAVDGAVEKYSEEEETAEIKPLAVADDDWCDIRKIPRRQWLYGQHYIRGIATATIAPGGVGKSTLAIIEGICIAASVNLLGVSVEDACPVWYWNGEEPRVEIARRVHAVCQHYKLDPHRVAKNFHFTSGIDEFPIKLVTAGKKGATVNDKLADHLIAFIKQNQFGVMIIDPLISSHGVPENDNVAMDAVAKTWARIAALTNCAVELAHHTRKPMRGGEGENLAADARGAGSLIDAVRNSRVLNQMTSKEAEAFDVIDQSEYFRANRGKTNMVRRGGASWFKLVSVAIGNGPINAPENGDNVQTVESWEPPKQNQIDITTAHKHAVRAKAAKGEYQRDWRADKWIGAVIAEIIFGANFKFDAREHPSDRKFIEQVLKDWIKEDVLKEVPHKNEATHWKERVFIEPGKWSEKKDDE